MDALTWQQLEDCIKNIDPEHKNDNVSIYVAHEDEFYPVVSAIDLVTPGSDGMGVLDEGCAFLRTIS